MGQIFEGFGEAFRLLVSFNPLLWSTCWVSLRVSLVAVGFATVAGLPIAVAIAQWRFTGRRVVVTMLNTLVGLPTVVVGLFLYSLLSRRGPLGMMELLYSPTAMVIGQFILATPIVAAISLPALEHMDPMIAKTALTLGASRTQARWRVLLEAKYAVMAGIVAAFGRVIGEVGCAYMVGGNIIERMNDGTMLSRTRTMSTTIALESSKGEFGLGVALGIQLLLIAFVVNAVLRGVQSKEKR